MVSYFKGGTLLGGCCKTLFAKKQKNRTPTRLSLLSYISFSQFIFQTFVRQSESFGKMGQIDKKIKAEYEDTSFLGKENWLHNPSAATAATSSTSTLHLTKNYKNLHSVSNSNSQKFAPLTSLPTAELKFSF